MSKRRSRTEAAAWEMRVFRNSYTYRGERRLATGWHVKLQREGRRRTLRLYAENRREAGLEAARLHLELRRGGWEAVERQRAATGAVGVRVDSSAAREPGGRVAPRRYVSGLRPGFTRELLAAVTHEGVTEYIALGTEDENAGRLKALELQREADASGWASIRLTEPREVTVAVFWGANPMTCTYATLLTIPGNEGAVPPPPRSRGWRILVVEPDGSVRRAMVGWLSQNPHTLEVRGVPAVADVTSAPRWDLLLSSREQARAMPRSLTEPAAAASAGPRLLPHGLYADSDAIFASVNGVSRGYFLRRVPPAGLLDPLLAAFPEPPRHAAEMDRQIRRCFQGLFETVAVGAEPQTAELTHREMEILDLLGRGFVDKEIALKLGISAWTVHSHLRRIFAKYGVRTRTEAVVRHLQK